AEPIYAELAAKQRNKFEGYTQTVSEECCIVAIVQDGHLLTEATAEMGGVEVVLDRTPFYAEAGGQVGDQGTLRAFGNQSKARVIDTYSPLTRIIVHEAVVERGTLRARDLVRAEVDVTRRDAI